MYWRLPAAQWTAQKGAANRRALRRCVAGDLPPGLIAYVAGEPAGWCAVNPRARFVRLNTSRVLKPLDDLPVWSVTCFFVAKPWRGRGLTVALLTAASRFARQHVARWLEGYPVDAAARQADVFVYPGLASAFRRAGFTEVARRSPTRPIFRRQLRR
jgi:GNAT superfamily N-acetyltransferase